MWFLLEKPEPLENVFSGGHVAQASSTFIQWFACIKDIKISDVKKYERKIRFFKNCSSACQASTHAQTEGTELSRYAATPVVMERRYFSAEIGEKSECFGARVMTPHLMPSIWPGLANMISALKSTGLLGYQRSECAA